ncbi:MAG: leucyl aminopeptidase family protein [Candidatus Kaiserbacteria bacterium]|nr:leucyl aminopeptidase family protein [Candidatus Kaiserbacteria bacterium]
MNIAAKRGFNISVDAKAYAIQTDLFLTELSRISGTLTAIAEKKGCRGEVGDVVIGTDEEGVRTYCVAIDGGDGTRVRDEGGLLAAWAIGEKVRVLEMDASVPEVFIEGCMLRNYVFSKHKTVISEKEYPIETIVTDAPVRQEVIDGVEANHIARDLMNEPANILHPKAYAERVQKLFENTDVAVEVLMKEELQNLGMEAVLSVGQGSSHESVVVVLRWNGAGDAGVDTALVGKGLTFDTGGVSLKPAKGMEEMKWDMGGSAAVVSAMHLIAKRSLQKNVVGVIGLVENAVDGAAIRPGDIIKTMSGKTVEVINTDAEGRLVLADILWYVQNRFHPTNVIDLATLTGAVIAALGKEYAGLFANDDALASSLTVAGERTGELVWHLPIHPLFLKRMKSAAADLRNVSVLEKSDAGAGTAAAFLREFIQKGTAWVHLDIAGSSFPSEDNPWGGCWPNGFGARMLYDFLAADRSPATTEQLLLPQ